MIAKISLQLFCDLDRQFKVFHAGNELIIWVVLVLQYELKDLLPFNILSTVVQEQFYWFITFQLLQKERLCPDIWGKHTQGSAWNNNYSQVGAIFFHKSQEINELFFFVVLDQGRNIVKTK